MISWLLGWLDDFSVAWLVDLLVYWWVGWMKKLLLNNSNNCSNVRLVRCVFNNSDDINNKHDFSRKYNNYEEEKEEEERKKRTGQD